MKYRISHKLAAFGFLAVAMLATRQLNAQHLTLEGQTGGFLTPTAYVVESDNGQKFSHPAVGIHFIDASTILGKIETFSITEGYNNIAEFGYTHSNHSMGNTPAGTATNAAFSGLWAASGMNVFHGKIVAVKDGQFKQPWMPGVAFGAVLRTGDRFVSGLAIPISVEGYDQFCMETMECEPVAIPPSKAYNNGDVYVAVTKTWAKPPVPFLVNVGWKLTNAAIFGVGGQSTRLGGRFFGGLGIPLPIYKGIVAVPSAGFTQEPRTVIGLGPATGNNIPLVAGKADLPTTLDYAVRVTQREHPHFSFDIGIGQVAGTIGNAVVPTYLPSPYPAYIYPPVNLEARKVVGMGLSYRY